MDNRKAADVFRLNDRITLLPVLHGSGECALMVRRWMLEHPCDCLAVPLPPSFQDAVESGVMQLPVPSIVIQPSALNEGSEIDWQASEIGRDPEASEESEDEVNEDAASYVPIDPCQPVIAALRIALGERCRRAFIDLETDPFIPVGTVMPDPYALKRVAPEVFATAILAAVPEPPDLQSRQRIDHMAAQLRLLEQQHQKILCICSILHWPWLRAAYQTAQEVEGQAAEVEPANLYRVEPRTVLFLFGELPLITGLYEKAREELEDDENLSLDGVKELLLTARDRYRQELKRRARNVTPLLLSQCLKYIRNMSLLERRMTPDLYTIAVASQQILGDQYARHVVEAAASYPYEGLAHLAQVSLGIDECRFSDGRIMSLASRLPGPPVVWRHMKLQRRPRDEDKVRWQARWDPFRQCSWPPEDQRIELFRTRVAERASAIVGSDLARTEKFTTSVKDGIDIRDTLRHWYEKQIYVRIMPPDRGPMDGCIMLFDSPADPRQYPWRSTWFAEHQEESTLAFFATDFQKEMVGPGIGLATYGGALFLFPPIAIPDIWIDPRLDFVDSLEERLIAAACMYARGPRVALLAHLPPGSVFRRIAKRFKKQLVHVPMSGFSDAEIQAMRMMHVLNGKEVRSYAAEFIRKV